MKNPKIEDTTNPKINDYGGAPVATRDHVCAVRLRRPAVPNLHAEVRRLEAEVAKLTEALVWARETIRLRDATPEPQPR